MADQRIEHLLRRAGFGASADDLAIFGNLSYGAAVDRIINYELVPDDVDSKIGQPGFVGDDVERRRFRPTPSSTTPGSGGCSAWSTRTARCRRR